MTDALARSIAACPSRVNPVMWKLSALSVKLTMTERSILILWFVLSNLRVARRAPVYLAAFMAFSRMHFASRYSYVT